MTLLTLASRQVWPQVLSVLHVRPEVLVLLHSGEESESRRPADRLKQFFVATGLLRSNSVVLRRVPHDQFKGVVDGLDNVAEELELDGTNCQVNLTGGNKLMAIAATEWCRLVGVRCFYLERDLRVFPFDTSAGDLLPQPEFQLDAHLAREMDPIDLLRCQLDSSEVVTPGQRITLNDRGRACPDLEFVPLLRKNFDFRKMLYGDIEGIESRPGDALEFATAFALLKLGVPQVRRGIRISPRVLRGASREEGELDLVFNWSARLWLVDCKDRYDAESRVNQLRTAVLGAGVLDPDVERLLGRIEEELREKDLKPLKEDILMAAEAAGLLGRALAVRRASLPEQARDFADSRNLPVILKERLLEDLRRQLYPDQPASMEQIKALAAGRTTTAGRTKSG